MRFLIVWGEKGRMGDGQIMEVMRKNGMEKVEIWGNYDRGAEESVNN